MVNELMAKIPEEFRWSLCRSSATAVEEKGVNDTHSKERHADSKMEILNNKLALQL